MSGRRSRCSGAFGRRGRAGLVRVLVLLVVLLGMGAMGTWVTGQYLVSEEVELPSLVGLGYERAAAVLHGLGLVPRAFAEIDGRAAPNQVLSQSPAAGQVVRPGRQVALGVNALAEVRVAPELIGMREVDALARADAVGAIVQSVTYVSSDWPSGTVVHQEPAPGSPLGLAQVMGLSVSRGARLAPFVLPDLLGRPIDEAEAALGALGVRYVERVAAALSFDRPGAVTDQRPAAGSEVVATTPVTLVYALEGTRVVRVPDLVGLPLWQAQLTLRAAQLEMGAVRRVDDPNLPEGVVEALPAGYTVAGSPIALIVNGLGAANGDVAWTGEIDVPFEPGPLGGVPSRQPLETDVAGGGAAVPAPGTSETMDDGSRVIPFRFDPAEVGVASLMREPYRLSLIVVDDEGERTVFDRELAAGEGLAVPVRVVGDEPLLQTFLNGSFFQAWRP